MALALALPSAAQASTVVVTPGVLYPSVSYAAERGEANRLVLSFSPDGTSVTVSDPGAAIAASGGCVAVDPSTARCNSSGDELLADVALGDGDDTLELSPPTVEPSCRDSSRTAVRATTSSTAPPATTASTADPATTRSSRSQATTA